MSSRTLLAGGDWQDYGAHCPVYLKAIKPSVFTIIKVDHLFIYLLFYWACQVFTGYISPCIYQFLFHTYYMYIWGCTILVFL